MEQNYRQVQSERFERLRGSHQRSLTKYPGHNTSLVRSWSRSRTQITRKLVPSVKAINNLVPHPQLRGTKCTLPLPWDRVH
jgi:hypothetical protein